MNSIKISMTDIDRLLKDKWRRNFKEDIIENREKTEREKMKKIIEEHEYVEKVNRELEEEKLKNKYKRLKDVNERMHDYQNFLEKKKINEILKLREKEKDRDLVSLDLKSDENFKNYKEHIIRLSDNVEHNMQKHRQFMQVFEKKPEINYENFQLGEGKLKSPNILNVKHNILNSPSSNSLLNTKSTPNIFSHRGTDVTNSDYFAHKMTSEFSNFQNAKKEFLKYNKEKIDEKEKKKQNFLEDKRKNKEKILEELEKNIKYEEALRQFQVEQQRNYKNSLDDQIKDVGISYSHKRVKSMVGGLGGVSQFTSENGITQRNANKEKGYLGESFIFHNPIINPVPNYQYNKYLFKDNTSSLKMAGNSLIY